MYTGQNCSWALSPEPSLGLRHNSADRAYRTFRPPHAFFNNFEIVLHEAEHSKTQSLVKLPGQY